MCFNLKTLLANRRKKPAKTAAPSPLPLDTVPATTTTKKKTTFADLPGEVRTEIYKLCIDSRRPFTTTNDVTLIMPFITTPAICRVNRATRPEALAVFVSRARWAVTGGSPTALGETSTRNGLNVRGGAGVGLGCGPLRSIPDSSAAASRDWVADRRQRFFPDDMALGTWPGWCAAIEALGREAENGISKLRVRAYAHAMCRPELVDIGGIVMGALWNEYGLLEWDVDLIEKRKEGRKRAFVKGRLTKRMVPVVAAAEDFLEELVAPLREKRVLGLLRAGDVRVLVETFVAYVADMGLSEETAFLKKIAF
ncbi:hypothetical protein UCDDS831_g07381 [Diplodia seriata]|uniref:Uncharacterized protein n=1 Tax=Diplodia seriata TaxID=420778 RepID=A0A0G2DYQ9_9PEZI|nr:hypothetical protein UCDDS831_g07381 [Diplodia seriata]